MLRLAGPATMLGFMQMKHDLEQIEPKSSLHSTQHHQKHINTAQDHEAAPYRPKDMDKNVLRHSDHIGIMQMRHDLGQVGPRLSPQWTGHHQRHIIRDYNHEDTASRVKDMDKSVSRMGGMAAILELCK